MVPLYNLIAKAYMRDGYFRKALRILHLSEKLGNKHFSLNAMVCVETKILLSDIYSTLGNEKLASKYLIKVYLIQCKHKSDFECCSQIDVLFGKHELRNDRLRKAYEHFERAQRIEINKFGAFHPNVVDLFTLIAKVQVNSLGLLRLK